jgi:hypothetical protein
LVESLISAISDTLSDGGIVPEDKREFMARFLKRLGCVIGRHAPLRRAVQQKGHQKTGPCRYCGTELEKRADGRWAVRSQSGNLAVGED